MAAGHPVVLIEVMRRSAVRLGISRTHAEAQGGKGDKDQGLHRKSPSLVRRVVPLWVNLRRAPNVWTVSVRLRKYRGIVRADHGMKLSQRLKGLPTAQEECRENGSGSLIAARGKLDSLCVEHGATITRASLQCLALGDIPLRAVV
jgi:hypothetical protein